MSRAVLPRSRRLSRSFYARPSLQVAPELVGCMLVVEDPAARLVLRLVEVEAYCGETDPASHGYRGMTPRNREMFATPGHLYVYFTYGMHHCMNVVTDTDGVAGAVLLRAGEVVDGEALMEERRGRGGREIASGPAKLTQALNVDLGFNGEDLVNGRLGIWPGVAPRRLGISSRVGIRHGVELPYRFFDRDSRCVSRARVAKPTFDET